MCFKSRVLSQRWITDWKLKSVFRHARQRAWTVRDTRPYRLDGCDCGSSCRRWSFPFEQSVRDHHQSLFHMVKVGDNQAGLLARHVWKSTWSEEKLTKTQRSCFIFTSGWSLHFYRLICSSNTTQESTVSSHLVQSIALTHSNTPRAN